MIVKDNFLLLTKSSKHGGSCIAGWIFDKQQNVFYWIRLVKDKDGADIKDYDYNSFFKERKVLDLIDVEFEPVPLSIQSENCLLLKEPRFIRNISFEEFDSSYRRFPIVNNANLLKLTGNFFAPAIAEQFHNSLMIVEVNDLRLYKNNEGKTKADFSFNGEKCFDYSVTDPDFFKIEKEYLFPNEKCKIILSISQEPFLLINGKKRHYKFISKIFNPNIYKL